MSHSFLKKFFLTTAAISCISSSAYAMPETLSINIKTSHYMDMGQTITRIAVGNPTVATVVQLPSSASEFLIVTKDSPGSTALFVWTMDGVRHEYLIVVSPEDPGQAMLIEQAINLPDVHVKMVADQILLTGSVENQYEKNYALQTARLFIKGTSDSSFLIGSGYDEETQQLDPVDSDDLRNGRGSSNDFQLSKSHSAGKIIDLLQIRNPTQIRLEAQIIEINSDNAKDLGLEYGTNGSGGIFTFGENYARSSHTTISETSTSSWSDANTGSNSSSYNGSNTSGSNSSTSNSTSSTSSYSASDNSYSTTYYDEVRHDNGYTDGSRVVNSSDASDSSNNSATSNGSNTSNSSSNSSSRASGSNFDIRNEFGRVVTTVYDDMVSFSNNPLKWIGQHFGPINATLNLLVTKGNAKILSRPSVMTLSGEQATIQIGGEIPYSTTSSDGTNTNFKKYGIILQVRPIVDAQNRINSMIHAEVSGLSGQTVNGQPIITTRSADSVVSLNSGSPIVIGGLMDSSETKTVSKIPLLGDIPIIGEFFKHTSKSRDKRELIIIVTPHIVGHEENPIAQVSPAMLEWYAKEQEYRDAMKSFNFSKSYDDNIKEIEAREAEKNRVEIEVEESPPRILPPSRLLNKDNNKSKTAKKSTTDKKDKSRTKNTDDVITFQLDDETDAPFSGK